jgi:hypothetical protein
MPNGEQDQENRHVAMTVVVFSAVLRDSKAISEVARGQIQDSRNRQQVKAKLDDLLALGVFSGFDFWWSVVRTLLFTSAGFLEGRVGCYFVHETHDWGLDLMETDNLKVGVCRDLRSKSFGFEGISRYLDKFDDKTMEN